MTVPSTPLVAELRDRLDELMVRDQRRLQRRLDELGRGHDDESRQRATAELVAAIDDAAAKVAARRAMCPPVTYPAELPITERRDDLLAAIAGHQVVVVAGETGSGKSTQLPKLCLELGRGVRGLIGHTQPRRIAARTVAERIADELGSELGETVGYTVRFTDRVGERTLIKVMTDGILLAEVQRDRWLSAYDTLIIDEAHERSLNIDFLLGYLHQLLDSRPDLKVIITSATIDTARFSEHFGGAPVIEVSGRTYPVEIRYRPIAADRLGHDDGESSGAGGGSGERDQVTAICDAVDELADEGDGDVLVFLSGEREIHDAADALRRRELRNTELMPLYARLSSAEQHRVFEPHRGRRIVLATNVAETSLTVPGVRYVVDAGAARISRYSRRLKVQRLPIEPISQASANQRAGRCGRVAAGICIRLYDEADFTQRSAFTEPEILRTNLASVILQMEALGLGEVAAFPFVDPPDARAVADGVALLEELGALDPSPVDPRKRLTPLGRRLAQLPVDPRLGRMILEAGRLGCGREVLVVAAMLSIQDPRERPMASLPAAEEAHRRFATDGSDFAAIVRLWDHLREQQRALSGNQFRRLCRSEFLNYLRVREWQDLYSQLRQVAAGLGVRVNSEPAHPDHVHRALLAGLLSHMGMRDGESREFRGPRGARFTIGRESVVARKPPRWVMVGELVETNRLWGRVAAPVIPEWAEELAGHLVKRSYGDPTWDRRRGQASVIERVSLYGLPIVSGRTIDYARIDADHARELFIRHALVDGEWTTHHRFLERNRALVRELRDLATRVRRHDMVIDDEEIFDLYDGRVGRNVTSARRFDQWWKRERERDSHLLDLTRDDLLRPDEPAPDPNAFPPTWRQGEITLAVSYHFEPGAFDDGVTVHVPLALLNQLTSDGFDWQVPGLRLELITALLRTAPKPVRRQLVPLAEQARAILERITPDGGRLVDVLADEAGRLAGQRVDANALDPTRIAPHLVVAFAVSDEHGNVVARGTDLAALQASLRAESRAAIAGATRSVERRGLTDWSIGTIDPVVETRVDGHLVRGHPALVDVGASVSLRLLTSPAAQQRAMRAGVRRLLLLTIAMPRKAMQQSLGNDVKLALARLRFGSVADLIDDCASAAVDAAIVAAGGPPWDEDAFRGLQDSAREHLGASAVDLAATAGLVVVAASAVHARLETMTSAPLAAGVADARAHLSRLVRPGFVAASGAHRLDHVLRYVRGIDRRLDKLAAEPLKDRDKMALLHRLERDYDDVRAHWPPDRAADELSDVFWLIEELRVSLYAQVLGTAVPVSEQRVRRELQRLSSGG